MNGPLSQLAPGLNEPAQQTTPPALSNTGPGDAPLLTGIGTGLLALGVLSMLLGARRAPRTQQADTPSAKG